MSVHAQVEGIGTLEFPDGTDPAVVQATVKRVIAQKGGAKPQDMGVDLPSAVDIAASAGSSAVAGLAGGIVKATGYAREGAEKLLTGHDPGDANAAAAKLEEFLTYHPKTEKGKAVMADVQKGLQAFEDWSDKQGAQAHDAIRAAGDKAGEVAKALGAPQSVVDFIDAHKEQVAAAYGSATKTAIQGAPLVLGGELTKLPGKVARPAVAEEAAASTTAAPGAAATPRARAESYVRDRLGLSWDAISDATKAKLERIAADARGLDRLNPEAVKRQATLESLKVPITTTAGKLNRDNTQLLREQGAAATPSGRSIVDTDVKANRDLRANVETLIDRLRGVGASKATATSREQVGAAVTGKEGALTLKQAKAKAATKAAYEKARNTDPTATVAPDAMYDFVVGNPEVLNPQIQHLGWLTTWLKKAGIETLDAEGKPTGERRPIKLTELDDLRKKAGKMAGSTGDSAHYAKEVMAAIDRTFEELPESAKAWKAAREAHKAERSEFANQGAIARLVETKGGAFGTDPRTALEDVWKASVKNAKLEEIRQLKRSLLSGDAEARVAGKKALRELRAETGQDLLREITKNVSTNTAGETNITAESINNWIKSMGGGTVDGGVEKLSIIIGRRATNELLKIREAAQITKTEPTVRNVGSNTFQKILNWMDDSGLGKLAKSVGGGPVVHGVEAIVKASQNPRTARAAAETATSAAERSSAKAQDKRAQEIQRSQTYGAQ
jgi:hypothetical protein